MKTLCTLALCLLLFAGCSHRNISTDKAATTQMTGAYTESRDISKEELALFQQTYKGDVELTPLSVSTQVVAGTNYMFVCKDKEGKKYKVVIYQKLPCYGGEAEVTSVDKL